MAGELTRDAVKLEKDLPCPTPSKKRWVVMVSFSVNSVNCVDPNYFGRVVILKKAVMYYLRCFHDTGPL